MSQESIQPKAADLLPRVSLTAAIQTATSRKEIEQQFYQENPHLFGDIRMKDHLVMATAFEGMILMYALLRQAALQQGKQLPTVSEKVYDEIYNRWLMANRHIVQKNPHPGIDDYQEAENELGHPIISLRQRTEENPELVTILEGTFGKLVENGADELDVIEMRLNAVLVYETLRLQAQVDQGLVSID